MNRPEDIPERVWAKANMAVVHAPEYTDRLHEDVARAILAAEKRVKAKCDAEIAAMVGDWSEFCAAIGVPVDTHEAVAERLIADRELIAEAKRYAASIRKGGEDA